jgi:hypothetical protein
MLAVLLNGALATTQSTGAPGGAEADTLTEPVTTASTGRFVISIPPGKALTLAPVMSASSGTLTARVKRWRRVALTEGEGQVTQWHATFACDLTFTPSATSVGVAGGPVPATWRHVTGAAVGPTGLPLGQPRIIGANLSASPQEVYFDALDCERVTVDLQVPSGSAALLYGLTDIGGAR